VKRSPWESKETVIWRPKFTMGLGVWWASRIC